MYGLAKTAEAVNVNYNRADQLQEEYDQRLDRIRELEGQRNPEVEAEMTRRILAGAGGGALIGGGAGALTGALRESGRKARLIGGAKGGAVGAAALMPLGLIAGGMRGLSYREANEDPELLAQIEAADDEKRRTYEKLQRQYVMEQQMKRTDQDRYDALTQNKHAFSLDHAMAKQALDLYLS